MRAGVPDFDRLHMNFERGQQAKRQQYKPTVPAPFKMESEPYRQMADETRKVRRGGCRGGGCKKRGGTGMKTS